VSQKKILKKEKTKGREIHRRPKKTDEERETYFTRRQNFSLGDRSLQTDISSRMRGGRGPQGKCRVEKASGKGESKVLREKKKKTRPEE